MAYTDIIDGTTVVNAASINDRFAQAYTDLGVDTNTNTTTCGNMLRNSSFESWDIDGAGDSPDAWEFTANDGVASRQAASSTYDVTGHYVCRVAKAFGDSGISYLEQVLTPIYNQAESCAEEYFTISAKISANSASRSRLYIDDGTKHYSDYATSTFATVTLTQQIAAGPTKFVVGIECKSGATYNTYVGDVQIVRGSVAPDYQITPSDHAPFITEFDDDGTTVHIGGGVRIVPFELTGTMGGSGVSDVQTYTIPANMRALSMVCVNATIVSLATSNENHCTVSPYYTSTSSITFPFMHHVSTFTASEAFVIRGFWIGVGWANNDNVFGAYP